MDREALASRSGEIYELISPLKSAYTYVTLFISHYIYILQQQML